MHYETFFVVHFVLFLQLWDIFNNHKHEKENEKKWIKKVLNNLWKILVMSFLGAHRKNYGKDTGNAAQHDIKNCL